MAKLIVTALGGILGAWIMSAIIEAIGLSGGGNIAGLMMVLGMACGAGAAFWLEKTFKGKKQHD